jgi:hypothetical protein
MTYDLTGANRRRGDRVEYARDVKLFEPSADRYIGGRTKDWSGSGIRVELNVAAPVRVGRLVSVTPLEASGMASRGGMVPARVVWKRRVGQRLEVGLEYLAASAAAMNAA